MKCKTSFGLPSRGALREETQIVTQESGDVPCAKIRNGQSFYYLRFLRNIGRYNSIKKICQQNKYGTVMSPPSPQILIPAKLLVYRGRRPIVLHLDQDGKIRRYWQLAMPLAVPFRRL